MNSKLQKKIQQGNNYNEKGFIKTILVIMKIFGYTYNEVMELPIPVYIEIVKFLMEKKTKW